MAWTPTESSTVSLVAADDAVLDAADLVVIVLNDVNITCLEENDTTLLMDQYQTIVNQALADNETKKVVRFIDNTTGTMKKVAILETKKLGSTLGGLLKSETSIESCAVVLPTNSNVTDLQGFTTELVSQLYTDERYKSSKAKDNGSIKCKSIKLIWTGTNDDDEEELPLDSVNRAKSVADGVFLTRDIVNAPHNVLNSFALAETAQRLAKESKGVLHCKILEARDCEKRGMGAFLGVARGSETYPKFIHLTYKPKGKRNTHM